jgi:hypothetical protein
VIVPQADGPTATRSQQQEAAAVQKAVAARKQRYLACAFPKLHVVAVNVTALRRADRRRSAPPSEPAKSAFFPVEDDRRMERSTRLLSSLIRPSSRKRVNLFQRESAQRIASASLRF